MSSASSDAGASPVRIRATPLTKGGSAGSGHATERHQRLRRSTTTPRAARAASAASSCAAGGPAGPARLLPSAIRIMAGIPLVGARDHR
jgi:hypothetical protein